jgi:branched-chain amino acid aminotransferase
MSYTNANGKTTTSLGFDQRDGFIWVDGRLLPWKEAKIHVLSHGLHYASSVFEGERAYNGKIFKSREHSERFLRSAEYLNFCLPYSVDELINAKEEVLKASGLRNAYVRPIAWRGSEMIQVASRNNSTHVAIAVWDWPSMFAPEERMQGITLDIAQYRRPSPDTAPVHAKSAGGYMIATISKDLAEQDGFADALMLDYEGYVAEATGANIFFVRDGTLHTPRADRFLNGITRQTVLEIASELHVNVVEERITVSQLGDYQECFLTGTGAEITPVAAIKELVFKPGKVTQLVMQKYEQLIGNY